MASSTDSSLGAAQKDVTREAKKLPATPSSPSTPAPTSHDAAKATAPAAPHTVATGGGPAASSGSKPSYSALSPDRRRLTLGIATAVGFFGPLAAGVYLPALPILETAFAASATAINATVSVFMATLAVAPLFWAARADAGGRRPLYLASMAIYILANVLLATVPAKIGALFVLRIVQAIGAAAGVSMGAGTVADITEPRRRAAAMSIVLLGPQLGPVLGPLIGGAISGNASWRWIFGFLGEWLPAALSHPNECEWLTGSPQPSAAPYSTSPCSSSSPRLSAALSATGPSTQPPLSLSARTSASHALSTRPNFPARQLRPFAACSRSCATRPSRSCPSTAPCCSPLITQ